MLYALRQYGNRTIQLYGENGSSKREGKAMVFLEEWCLRYGSTLRGRIDASCLILHCRQKVPVLINDEMKDLLFPLEALSCEENLWINYRGIAALFKEENGTVFEFRNGFLLKTSVSMHRAKRQMALCRQFMEYLSLLKK